MVLVVARFACVSNSESHPTTKAFLSDLHRQIHQQVERMQPRSRVVFRHDPAAKQSETNKKLLLRYLSIACKVRLAAAAAGSCTKPSIST